MRAYTYIMYVQPENTDNTFLITPTPRLILASSLEKAKTQAIIAEHIGLKDLNIDDITIEVRLFL